MSDDLLGPDNLHTPSGRPSDGSCIRTRRPRGSSSSPLRYDILGGGVRGGTWGRKGIGSGATGHEARGCVHPARPGTARRKPLDRHPSESFSMLSSTG